jgi:cytosine deaminase
LYKEKILDAGQQRLSKLRPSSDSIGAWKAYLVDYQPLPGYLDDTYVWLACTLALASVESGNFGVGSILVNGVGDVAVQGHNQVFTPHFRSDRHAEMVVMDNFEDFYPSLANLEGYTLYTSLEPCPMCLVRLSTSNISKVLFVAADETGGMVGRINNLPPFWLELAQRKMFGQAQCAQGMINAATQIFSLNLDTLMAKIKAR